MTESSVNDVAKPAAPQGLSSVITSLRIRGKDLLCRILEWQVLRLRRKYPFQVVAVAGSIGKTSAKLAIAHTLSASRRVAYQEGNYNDRLTVPLVVFGQTLPGLLNVLAWLKILAANERIIRRGYNYDIAVLELGTDGPGQIGKFAYLKPDITIITAITPEHMEYFKTLDAVAAEELTVATFSKSTIINIDDTPRVYLARGLFKTYGLDETATYQVDQVVTNGLAGLTMELKIGDAEPEPFASPLLGMSGAKITAAAIATAHELGLDHELIRHNLAILPPTPGRMQILHGLNDTTIIDDTYNASPAPVKSGLDMLAAIPASRHIAILGSMNELGDYSQEAHEEVGDYCKPANVDLVVTIGRDAEAFLAPRALQNGCRVVSFMSPYEAGAYVKNELIPRAIVLAEGSQNGVFAEEAVKQLLNDPADSTKLVRQSPAWLAIKPRQFKESAHL